tara:strand:+ start:89 stop:841 length:753 start_codon:yes stop_codon:yes gene_type:complete
LTFNTVKDSFDKAAERYDENSYIQKKSLDFLVDFLFSSIDIKSNKKFKALDIGCGTGESSILLLKKINFQSLTLLDLSKNMLELAAKKINRDSLELIETDFDNFQDYSKFNMIYSNMSIHWSKNFKRLIRNILNSVGKTSVILFSYVNSSSFKYFHNLSSFDIKILNSFPKHNDLLDLIDRKRFKYFHKEITINKIYNCPLQFFYDLKSYGANYKLNSSAVGKLFMLRKIKKKININFNISYYSLKKIEN